MTSPIIPFNQTTAIDQACAIPFRSVARQLEFCLITSSSGRWLFPKGFIDPGETFVEAALKEAAEEAGVHGRVLGDPVGLVQDQEEWCHENGNRVAYGSDTFRRHLERVSLSRKTVGQNERG